MIRILITAVVFGWWQISPLGAQVAWPPPRLVVGELPIPLSRDARIHSAVGPNGDLALLDLRTGRFARVGVDGAVEAGAASTTERRFSGIGFVGDTMWLAHAREAAITLVLRREQWHVERGTRPGNPRLHAAAPAALLRGGVAVVEPLPIAREMLRTGRADHPLLLLSATGNVVDTLATLRTIPGMTVLPGAFLMYDRFSDDTRWAAAPSGDFVVVVHGPAPATESHATFSVRSIGAGGEVRWEREVAYTPIRIPDVIRRATLDTAISMAGASTAERIAVIEEALDVPSFYPPVSAVLVSAAGPTWVKRSWRTDEPQQWSVFDRSGSPIGDISVPAGVEILGVADGFLWAVDRREDEVRLVQVAVPR